MNDVTGLRAGDLISRKSYTWLCQAALSERSSQVTGVGSLQNVVLIILLWIPEENTFMHSFKIVGSEENCHVDVMMLNMEFGLSSPKSILLTTPYSYLYVFSQRKLYL